VHDWQIAEATAPENDLRQHQAGEDVALLRPLLGALVVGLYSWAGLLGYDSFNAPYVPGWEGRVPYFSRYEVVLPWLCLTAALAAYLAGALAVRLSGKPVVGISLVAVAALVAGLLLTQATRARDRDYDWYYGKCRPINEIKDRSRVYACEGGGYRDGPPPYPYPRRGFFAAVSLGLAVFSAAPRLPLGRLRQRTRSSAAP
jgi:hypothetical protein